jgi:hypothetical protein
MRRRNRPVVGSLAGAGAQKLPQNNLRQPRAGSQTPPVCLRRRKPRRAGGAVNVLFALAILDFLVAAWDLWIAVQIAVG